MLAFLFLVSLFDGHSLNGWMWTHADPAPLPSWTVQDGLLKTTPGVGKEVYLITKQSFTDFEFSFEWKIAAKGNSGIKYRFQNPGGILTENDGHRIEPFGLEYQIADDIANKDAISDPKHSSGAIYEYITPKKRAPATPDVWHTGKIVAKGTHIEHWMDGEKVVDIDLTSGEAEQEFSKSSRKRSAPILRKQDRRESPIALQFHDGEVWFRNLNVRTF